MEKEIYKDITGYEGLYQVSDRGNVVRVGGGQGAKTNRVLKHRVDKDGYYLVNLCKECVKKTYKVHRLVALAFISNPLSKEQVNHIDGVKSNNSISNLEWNTRSENQRHSVDVLGNQLGVKGEKHYLYGRFGADNPTSKAVIQLNREGVEVKRYGSTMEAQRDTGVSNAHISKVCLGKYKSAGGFIWSYA